MTAVPALDPSYVQLLETIRRDEKVARALEIALEEVDRAMEEQIELCEIEAPTFAEEKRAARVAELMRAYGLTDVVTDPIGNVVGRRQGRNPEGPRACARRPHGLGLPRGHRREGPP